MLNVWNRLSACASECMKTSDYPTLPLCNAQAGKRLKVACIDGGRRLCARMASMGIYPGVEMEVLCSGCGRPCLVRVHGGTISLGAGLSDKIMVTSA
jgi:ferrous iron transport protein A